MQINTGKYLYVFICVIFILLIAPSYVYSQCNFSVKAVQQKESDCQSNGIVKATLEGSSITSGDIQLTNAQYSIASTMGGYTTSFAVNNGIINNVPAGTYKVIARAFCNSMGIWVTKESNVITVNSSYNVPDLNKIYIVTANIKKSLKCGTTGSIPIKIEGGKPPYTITISNAPSNYNGPTEFKQIPEGIYWINNLAAGSYSFKLRDDCTYTLPLSASVGEIIPQFNITSTQNSKICVPEGSITVNMKDGLEPYTIIITDAPAGYLTPDSIKNLNTGNYTIKKLLPGTYKFTIKDACGYSKKFSQNIYTITPQAYNKTIQKTISCQQSGVIEIDIDNGVPPYNINITQNPASYSGSTTFIQNNSGTFTINNLPHGDYKFEITDSCNYKLNVTAKIDIDKSKITNLQQNQSILCQATGNISFNISGGLEPYKVNLTNHPPSYTGQTLFNPVSKGKFNLNNIYPGNYNFEIVDNCNDTIKISAKVDTVKLDTKAVMTALSLNCIATGEFEIIALGGKPPYSIHITNLPSYDTTLTLNNPGKIKTPKLPIGTYIITVTDACGTTDTLAGNNIDGPGVPFDLPNDAFEKYFYPPNPKDSNCKSVIIKRNNSNANKHLGKHWDPFSEEYFKVSFQFNGTGPQTPWEPVKATMQYTLPTSYKDVHETNSFLIARVRPVNDSTCSATPNHIDTIWLHPVESIIYSPQNPSCQGFSISFQQHDNEKGIFCYPYSCEIRDSVGNVIKTLTNIKNSYYKTINNILPYGKVTVHFKDKDGYQWGGDTIEYRWKNNSVANISYTKFLCTTYAIEFNDPYICTPYSWILYKPDSTVHAYKNNINSKTEKQYADLIEYNKKYRLHLIDNNKDTFKYNIEHDKTFIYNYAVTSYTEACSPNVGKGYIKLYRTGNNNKTFEVGTRIEFISGPTQPTHSNFILNSTQNNITEIYPFSTDTITNQQLTNIEKGEYTFKITDNCNIEHIIKIDYKNYKCSDFKYKLEETCSGAKLYPEGSILLGDLLQIAYFRILSAPNGIAVNPNPVSQGGYLFLPESGKYVIQMSIFGGTTFCMMDTLSIMYIKRSVELDKDATKAYICDENSVAYIIIRAIGGVGPYSYDLIDAGTQIMSNNTGVFNYGQLGETYTIRINDHGCGVSFEQDITVLDLSKEQLIYGTNDVCKGGKIELNCLPISKTYDWKGPNSFTSNLQNPKIEPAQLNMSGTYSVTIKPEGCIKPMLQNIDINIHQPKKPIAKDKNIECLDTTSITLKATPLANHYLQWYDKDGITKQPSAPIITINNVDTLTYYVSQIDSIMGCESELQPIQTIISDLPDTVKGGYAPTICSHKDAVIIIPKSLLNYTYNIYTEEKGGVLIGTGQGTNDTIKIQTNNTLTTKTTYYIEAFNENQCVGRGRAPVKINVYEPPKPLAEGLNIQCHHGIGQPLKAVALNNHSLQWYDNDGVTILNSAPVPNTTKVDTFTYYVSQLHDTLRCESKLHPIKVMISDLPKMIPDVFSPTICTGIEPIIIIPNAQNNYLYKIYDVATGGNSLGDGIGTGDTLKIQTNKPLTDSTIYYIETTNNNQCVGPKRTLVDINVYESPKPEAEGINIQCLNSNSKPLEAQPLPDHSLQWYDKNGADKLNTPPIPNTSKVDTITYYVSQIHNTHGCESPQTEIQAIISDLPKPVLNPFSPDICPDMKAVVVIPKSNSNYIYNVYTQDKGGDLISGTEKGTGDTLKIKTDLPLKDSTIYYIETINENDCPGKERTPVNINVIDYVYIKPDKLPSFGHGKHYKLQLETNAALPYQFTYTGSLPFGLNITPLGEISGVPPSNEKIDPKYFTVKVVDNNGCIATKDYELKSDIFTPQAFTPNNDGVNDYFMKGNRLIIFDRLGVKIFEGDDGWDGTQNGKPAPADTYFYIIYYTDDDGSSKQKTGYITIIRRR